MDYCWVMALDTACSTEGALILDYSEVYDNVTGMKLAPDLVAVARAHEIQGVHEFTS